MNLAVLPTEIVDEIIYYLGFKIAYCLNNEYVINRYLKNFIKKDWEYIFRNADGHLIWYMYKNKLNNNRLNEFIKFFVPCYYSDIFHTAVESGDLPKMYMIDRILPKSSLSMDTYKLAVRMGDSDIKEWIDKNRPVLFLNFRIKKNKCEKILDSDLIRLPLDVQETYKKKSVKCSCKKCGGDGIGYN